MSWFGFWFFSFLVFQPSNGLIIGDVKKESHFLKKSHLQRSFNNYVNRILPFLTPSPCLESFYTLSVDKNRHCLTPSPLILSTQLLKGHLPILVSALFCSFNQEIQSFWDFFFCYFRIDISRWVYNRKSYFEFQTRLLSRGEKWRRIFSNGRLLSWAVYNGMKSNLDFWIPRILDSWISVLHNIENAMGIGGFLSPYFAKKLSHENTGCFRKYFTQLCGTIVSLSCDVKTL